MVIFPLGMVTFLRCVSSKCFVLWLVRNICQFGISGACRQSELPAEMRVQHKSHRISFQAELEKPCSNITTSFSFLALLYLICTNEFTQGIGFVVHLKYEWDVNFLASSEAITHLVVLKILEKVKHIQWSLTCC